MRLQIEKYQSRRIRIEIRRVLREVWDPIGVRGDPPDEYDSYDGEIYELLITGASDEAMKEHLRSIVTDHIGLPATKEGMTATVTALREISLTDDRAGA